MSVVKSSDVDYFTYLIFSPDPLSRIQYENVHGSQESSTDYRALRALMLAVLRDGIACFQSYFFQPSRTNERLYREEEEWIGSSDDGIFSFNNVCETLGLDPGRLRKGLEQWKAKQLGSPLAERKRILLNKGKLARKKRTQLKARPLLSMQNHQKSL